MSANKYSHTYLPSPPHPWLKTHQPKARRNVAGLHPELRKQPRQQPRLETPFRQKLEVGSFPNKPDDSMEVKRTNQIMCSVLPYYLRVGSCWSSTARLLREGGMRDLPLAMVGWGCSTACGKAAPETCHGGMEQSSCSPIHVAHSYLGIPAKGTAAIAREELSEGTASFSMQVPPAAPKISVLHSA